LPGHYVADKVFLFEQSMVNILIFIYLTIYVAEDSLLPIIIKSSPNIGFPF